MPSGKRNFTTFEGTKYVIDKYLTAGDKRELRFLNNGLQQDEFRNQLIERVHERSGDTFIPANYEDEFASNATAVIGSMTTNERLKTKERTVTVYETPSGKRVYEDKRGRLRDFRTGRYTSRSALEE